MFSNEGGPTFELIRFLSATKVFDHFVGETMVEPARSVNLQSMTRQLFSNHFRRGFELMQSPLFSVE
jgi:hypothetical protein